MAREISSGVAKLAAISAVTMGVSFGLCGVAGAVSGVGGRTGTILGWLAAIFGCGTLLGALGLLTAAVLGIVLSLLPSRKPPQSLSIRPDNMGRYDKKDQDNT